MNAVTVEEAFLLHNPPPLFAVKPVLKLFLPYDTLYVNGVKFCEVSGTKPPEGYYRVDILFDKRLCKPVPTILDTKFIIDWDHPERDLADSIRVDTYKNYLELTNQIIDAINAGIDVTFTV